MRLLRLPVGFSGGAVVPEGRSRAGGRMAAAPMPRPRFFSVNHETGADETAILRDADSPMNGVDATCAATGFRKAESAGDRQAAEN